MAGRSRLLIQSAFLALSLCVFFGVLVDRRIVAFYHALHLGPTVSSLPWLMLPPLGWFSAAVTAALSFGTLLFGRWYCSYLCPAGFLQDLSRRLARAAGLPAGSSAGWGWVRLFILGLCVGLLFSRSSAYHWFDHFSGLGRVYGLAWALRAGGPFGWNFAAGLAFLAVLVVVPLRWPRWFCGALCPSGSVFMILGKLRARFGRRPTDEVPESPALSRRELLAGVALTAMGAAAGAGGKRLLLKGAGPGTIIPPGGRTADQFFERCAACDNCIGVCPTRVLVPANRGRGLSVLAKVRLDYDRSYCSYECNACLGVCPTGAISYFPLRSKKRIRMGKSRLSKDICIPFKFERDCGACQEQCPTGAITMDPYKSTAGPVLHEDYCIGCGACQFACPTRPAKAIVVDAVDPQSFAFAPKAVRKRPARVCAGPDCGKQRPETDGFPF